MPTAPKFLKKYMRSFSSKTLEVRHGRAERYPRHSESAWLVRFESMVPYADPTPRNNCLGYTITELLRCSVKLKVTVEL